MSFEVDVLAVGEESKSGDAIALRFGDFLNNPGDQFIVVIDGGFAESGEKLANRIVDEYGTDYVDLVISTHPDSDHINGLTVILEKLKVGELWIHTPWNVSEEIKKLAEERALDNVITPNKLKKSLERAYDLERLAVQKGIKIVEPFEGLTAAGGKIHVLGPSLEYYFQLVAQFNEASGGGLSLATILEKARNLITESWDRDVLVEPDEKAVSSRNNSSVISLINLGENFLFVGDAGVTALTNAADYADSLGVNLASHVNYLHIPHHGSKRNLGPEILNRLVGPILPRGQKISKHGFISAAQNNTKHPSKRVSNALLRRGITVTATCGIDHCFRSEDVPMRPGWGPIPSMDFHEVYPEE